MSSTIYLVHVQYLNNEPFIFSAFHSYAQAVDVMENLKKTSNFNNIKIIATALVETAV